jgi:hypothetical protein
MPNLPLNNSGLTALAMQLAADYFNQQVGTTLDEVFPGTYAWQPDGGHDIIWTFSERAKQGSTRVLATQWNQSIKDFQHSHVPLSGYTNVPAGVGGPSVPQSWVDSQQNLTPTQIVTSGTTPPPVQPNISVTLCQTLAPTDPKVIVNSVNFLPTQNRWRGTLSGSNGAEVLYLEGTSGGLTLSGSSCFYINVVYRGIDGTIPTLFNNDSVLAQVCPNTTYGANLVRHEKMQFVYPNEWTSGGIQACNVVPQTQTVYLLDGSGTVYNGTRHFSGVLNTYDPTQMQPWSDAEDVFAVQRNSGIRVFSGYAYGGQLVGYSPSTNSGVVAPVYAIDDFPYLASGDAGGGGISGCCSGLLSFVANPSLGTCFINPNSVFSPGVFSQTPGIWNTTTSQVTASGCCQTAIISCVQFPFPQPSQSGQTVNCCQCSSQGGFTLVAGPCPTGCIPVPLQNCIPGGGGSPQYIFPNSCSISWSFNINGNVITQTAFWNGMCVLGSRTQDQQGTNCTNACDSPTVPGNVTFNDIDTLFFSPCDFTVGDLGVSSCCGDNPSITPHALGINTVGLTQDISVLDGNCNLHTMCFLRGLLKAYV